jgi:hypothetical protein
LNAWKIPVSRQHLMPLLPYIVRSIYPIGKRYVTWERATRNIVDAGYRFRPEVKKASGASVPTDLFLREEYSGISAILFSGVEAANRPDNMGGDFVFVHNFMARNCANGLPIGFLKLGREFWVEEGKDDFILRETKHV